MDPYVHMSILQIVEIVQMVDSMDGMSTNKHKQCE